MGELKIGDIAPDFNIKDHKGKEVKLGDQRGKAVVLGFHPLAWTSVCATQMKDLDASIDRLEALRAVGFGISIDSTFCKKAWAENLGLAKLRLLSDFWPHGEVAASFGVFRDADGFSERAVFVLDKDGKVAWKKVYPIKEVPDIKEIMAAVEAL
jgi:peroxiredoxin